MAVIHVTEAEAMHQLPELFARVRSGENIVLDTDLDSCALVRLGPAQALSVSEIIRRAEERGPCIVPDAQFADDLEHIMRFNRQQGWPNEWE